jgi:hypothetical protein
MIILHGWMAVCIAAARIKRRKPHEGEASPLILSRRRRAYKLCQVFIQMNKNVNPQEASEQCLQASAPVLMSVQK